jgi:hypothetical protein
MHYVYTAVVTSDGSGDATTSFELHGFVTRLETDPSATAPTADWDLVLTTAAGVDVLGGAGADRHTSASEQILPIVAGDAAFARVDGTVTLTASNMGAAKIATVYIYVSE